MSKKEEDKKSKKKDKDKDLVKLIEDLTKERDEYLSGWKRSQADFENFKKRKQEEMSEFREYTQSEIILRILPIFDNFEKAYAVLPKNLENDPWTQGIKMIKSEMKELLTGHNVKEIEAVGKEFDPVYHEAVKKTGTSDKISQVVEKGYTLNDKVIRPAKVIL